MPLKLDIKRKLSARSDRVKCVDLHPTESWMVASLFNGQVHIWNLESQQLIKTFEICDLPVRAVKFIARKNWIVTGSDDMQLRVFNYNTLERIHHFDAHSDYIRSIAVHPVQSFLLTSSDDMLIKLWDWDRQWICSQVFEGHSHYIMQLAFNPKDNNTFASASLDKTIKVWNLGQPQANFTLEGHDRGVNCIDYYCGGDKPYIVSGADDRLVKIWDYQTKTCVQTLEGHAQNVSCVSFHPELPIILSGSEDGTVRVWHANTYRLESTLNYGMERVWSISCLRGSNTMALGYDEGSIVVKLGREEPAMSMDNSGKIVFAKHAEVQQINLKGILFNGGDDSAATAAATNSSTANQDGERLPVSVKNMGTCDIYPQTVVHNANGRFVVVCGDGEYIVYTAMALRNKSFGQAQEFVWAQQDATMFATREGSTIIKIYKNFKESRTLKPDLGVEQIFGGWLLGVRSSLAALSFYDWESGNLIRRIELSVSPKSVYWNERGQLVGIVSDESTFILHYSHECVRDSTPDQYTEDGLESAFDLLDNGELNDSVKTAAWVGDCLLYTNAANRLQYFVGGEIVTVAHLDRQMYLLGYLPKENRAFLGDRDVNIVSYSILLSVLEYQTAVMRQDFTTADTILPSIPRDQRTRVAHFLERRGFPLQALAVTTDNDHKFDLAIHLGKLHIAYDIASQDQENTSIHKWKQLAEAASKRCDFNLAQECLSQAGDNAALLLLATSCGNDKMMQRVGQSSHDKAEDNVSFLAKFLLQDLQGCLQLLIDSDRLPEATLFARTYLPSKVPVLVELWRKRILLPNLSSSTTNESPTRSNGTTLVSQGREKLAQSLANPLEYDNLFPGWRESCQVEEYLSQERRHLAPASAYSHKSSTERDVFAEMLAAGTTTPATAAVVDSKNGRNDKDDDEKKKKEDDDDIDFVKEKSHENSPQQPRFDVDKKVQEENEKVKSSYLPPPQRLSPKPTSPSPPPPPPSQAVELPVVNNPLPKKNEEEDDDDDDEDLDGEEEEEEGNGVDVEDEDEELEEEIANIKLESDELAWDVSDEEEENQEK